MPLKQAFQPEIIPISIADIVPIKRMAAAYRKGPHISTHRGIHEAYVGLIEPLVVFPTTKGNYILLDGHTRLDVLIATSAGVASNLLPCCSTRLLLLQAS